MGCPNCQAAHNCPLDYARVQTNQRFATPRGLNGIFNVNKPAKLSSHDVVNVVRRASRASRVGHAGTLDPIATGVLLVCIGQGVRVSEYLTDHDKKYRARIRLGITTDTDDATGAIIAQRDGNVSRAQIERALKSFVGKISQMPPRYSAIKRDGVPLYKLARRGIEIEMMPRNVEIFEISLIDAPLPEIEIDVHCSKGTYIRSIARDLGEKLGCGAMMRALTRTASGNFSLTDAIALDDLRAALEAGFAERYVYPLDDALLQYEAIIVEPHLAKDIQQGKSLNCGREFSTPLLRAYTADGDFIALLERGGAEMWKPRKVFLI
ncbi:MAG: tRNA pseudouridine(55) synthase TruB [Chloroflexi bacterium]|nr:tRNA pseudouridine(55) synthase TruB [Chloroflexota bacterium]